MVYPQAKVEFLPWDDEARHLRHAVRVRRKPGRAPPVDAGYALQLTFDEPVPGPLTLGYAAHLGLGGFVAASTEGIRNDTDAPPETHEATFANLHQEWTRIAEHRAQAWEPRFQDMLAEHEGLVSRGRWTIGPADLLSIVGRSRRETIHCSMLAWLFDPRRKHGLFAETR